MESNFSPPFDKLVWRSERDRWRNEGRRLGKLDSIPLPLPPRAIIAHVEGKFVRGPGALASGSKNADVVPPPRLFATPGARYPVIGIGHPRWREGIDACAVDRSFKFRDVSPPIWRARCRGSLPGRPAFAQIIFHARVGRTRCRSRRDPFLVPDRTVKIGKARNCFNLNSIMIISISTNFRLSINNYD